MPLFRWIQYRQSLRRAWAADARMLIERDEANAYYEAHRLAARARRLKDSATAWHWSKVAAEIARLSPNAETDWQRVKRIADEEGA